MFYNEHVWIVSSKLIAKFETLHIGNIKIGLTLNHARVVAYNLYSVRAGKLKNSLSGQNFSCPHRMLV